MARSQKEEQILQGMMNDIGEGQKTVSQSAIGRGVKEDMSLEGFGVKALRYKGQVFAEKELAEAKTLFNDHLKDLMSTAEFANDQDRANFQAERQRKFNKFQLDMIRRGSQMEHAMRSQNLKDEERAQMTAMFANSISNVTQAAVASSGKKKEPTTANSLTYMNTGSDFDPYRS